MVEWLVKKTKYYKELEDENNNYILEMSAKQSRIRYLERKEKENKEIIEDLINKLDIKEKERRKAIGKLGSLQRKIKGGAKNV